MKIVFASHTGVFKGGAERSLKLLCDHGARSHDIMVTIPDGNENLAHELNVASMQILKDKDKTSLKTIGVFKILSKVQGRLIYMIKYGRFLLKYNPDIVYLNTIRTTSELIVSRLLRYPAVMHIRGFDSKLKLRYFFLRYASRVIVLNEEAKAILRGKV